MNSIVNKLVIGTAQFGLNYGINNSTGKPSKQEVFEILNFAKDNDINKLDTASAYGNAQEVIGEYHSKIYNGFEVNTKFHLIDTPLREQLNTSLKQLKRDKIDSYFYHSFEQFMNEPKIIGELEELKAEGLIKQIGLSVYDNNEFEHAINQSNIDVIQFPFNLLDNKFQRENLILKAKAKGKILQARSVFLQGLFFMPLDKLSVKLVELKPYLNEIETISIKYSIAVENLALLYVIQESEIDQVIIGVDSKEQLKSNLDVLKMKLPNEAIEEIEKIRVKETHLLYPKNWN